MNMKSIIVGITIVTLTLRLAPVPLDSYPISWDPSCKGW